MRTAILELLSREGIGAAEQEALVLIRHEELEDSQLSSAVVRYLAAIRSSELEPELRRLIADGQRSGADLRLVESALTALAEVGSTAGGELLLEKLADPEYPESLKPRIILALGKLAHSPAVEALIEVVEDRGAERTWRMYAAVALGEIGDRRAVAPLKELFREQDSLIKVYAASGLASFGMPEVETLLHQGLRDSNERVRAAAAQGLANPDASASVEILIYKAKNDPARQVRIEAIRALGRIGTPPALAFLRELYGEGLAALQYREEALVALCESDLQGNLSAIAQVVDAEWAARDQKIVGLTARILSTRQSPELADLYERFLGHPDVGVRIYALRGIAANRIRSLRKRVEALSSEDPHPAAQRAATAALDRL